MNNKQTVLDFYREVIGQRKIELLDNYIHPGYIQHSASVPDGREGLKSVITNMPASPPGNNNSTPVKCVIEENDLVALYMEIMVQGQLTGVADIFRIQHNLVIEHWDAMQILTVAPANDKIEWTPYLRLQDNMHLCIQSSGNNNEQQFVRYAFYSLDDTTHPKWLVTQVVPKKMPHGNGML